MGWETLVNKLTAHAVEMWICTSLPSYFM